MCIISIIKRYWYIRKLDRLVFPEKPIPIKVVLRKEHHIAGYMTDEKRRRQKPNNEWYEIMLNTKSGNDFNIAAHEVRHRVQKNFPELPLFTKEKLVALDKREPEKDKKAALDYLEAIEREKHKSLPEYEQDAVIVATLTEQRYKAGFSLEIASQLLKQAP